ncbi:MAG: PLP-dependent aspartate aminotransferase family protein [Pseudomonadota bacterium]
MTNTSRETRCVQAAGAVESETGAIVPPVHIATTFERDPDNSYPRGFTYGRPHNATVQACEDVINGLESGAATLAFGSGMAAALSLFLALPRPAHVVAPNVMYWALRNWLKTDAASHGLSVTFVDSTDLAAIGEATRPGQTKLIWIETPSNPLWSLADIAGCATIARSAGANLAVDSTAATPVLSQPLTLGADIVMHSATKYLNGHSDVLAGTLTFASADSELYAAATQIRSTHGAILGPFEAALLLRGLRTLFVRVERQCLSARAIAEHFTSHDQISHVLYPGLATHPQYELAQRQMVVGSGGMLSLRFAGGQAAAIAVASALKVWVRATSLGGVESLVEHRASVEGAGTPCPDDLLRLSVGLEAVDDLIKDLDQALAAAHGS